MECSFFARFARFPNSFPSESEQTFNRCDAGFNPFVRSEMNPAYELAGSACVRVDTVAELAIADLLRKTFHQQRRPFATEQSDEDADR